MRAILEFCLNRLVCSSLFQNRITTLYCAFRLSKCTLWLFSNIECSAFTHHNLQYKLKIIQLIYSILVLKITVVKIKIQHFASRLLWIPFLCIYSFVCSSVFVSGFISRCVSVLHSDKICNLNTIFAARLLRCQPSAHTLHTDKVASE